ncbi:DNA translocase FtsK [Candidatus Woesebacteria bacterium]|nr:DNA translocase FtsK [Candidatus Woesebacteria bacterium]QQG47761.1 MAG: DNA translocase FtsK [Candidatus Woesebacteria bacterium]
MGKKKKKNRAKNKKAFRLKLKPHTVHSVAQLTFFAMAALISISFARRGLILIGINDFLFDFFGWATIFLPFIFLSFGFYVSKFKNPLSQPNVVLGGLIFSISMTALTKSGKIGLQISDFFITLLTSTGATVLFLAMLFIGIVILFNTSVDQLMKSFVSLLKYTKKFLVAEKETGLGKNIKLDRKELKVIGGNSNFKINSPPKLDANKKPVEEKLEAKLVSNMPGEEQVWKYPPVNLLVSEETHKADRGDIKGNAAVIEQTLESFGITARVVEVNMGPAVTRYALEVALGTKLSKITALERDLALALAAPGGSIRVEAPIPGRSLVGIELPNKSPEFVPLRKMMSSDIMRESTSKLTVALGLDVAGEPVVANISRMPHVLIAGQTGSGKSVCINTFLASLLFRASPQEVKLILVDPKRVELTGYNDIPHLLTPVIVEPEKVISALRWVLSEMERRYKLFQQAGVRNLESYNEMSGFQALPYIVVVIDELADIMLFSPVEVEDSITRIAQMSRATGIHMVLATQRPSVDVITGLIKANIPARIAFAVSSQVDSRVILDGKGAEKLLGRGDMLYLTPEQAKPMRIQGAFISDKEISSLVSFIKNQGIAPQYTEEVTAMSRPGAVKIAGIEGDTDDLFKEAVKVVVQYDKASASLLQRRLSIGYARAARIIDQLEAAGVVGQQPEGSKPREVLVQNPEQVFGSPTDGN